MGLLIDGAWHTHYARTTKDGRFARPQTQFRHWVTPDGAAGPTGEAGFPAEAGRYHLYVSYACPWASRALILRVLKGLEGLVGLSVVHWFLGEDGWHFDPADGVIPDTVNGVRFLRELYTRADPACSGKVTVPVLWDKKRGTIVNNESADILRMFNRAFDGVGANREDFFPEPLRAEIDRINARIYDTVNDGVYKAGFATSQEAYESAVVPLFETLDWLEERLGRARFLVGARPTEADFRLFTTLVRFDAVYHGHFKCNLRRLLDYPNLWAYTRDLYQWPGVAETVRFDHIKGHYYGSHRNINPTGIVPVGPALDLLEPHDRASKGG
ncbi:glutathione S-transferase family protein [Pendulispora albinea]|uniref:Glutathione S-transferase family protein n=1 Tax=Pendulispora albinea TaxID=2741071 RepID=A0ABZ2M5J2_9BACT